MPYLPIGKIKLCQIQTERAKDRSENVYDPSRIHQTDFLELSVDGVVGYIASGEKRLDVHHNQHHGSRSRGDNTLSICFTSHYERARRHFGQPLLEGCMGENLLVESNWEFRPGLPAQALAFQREGASQFIIKLTRVAPPCRAFSRYASGDANGENLASALRFLSDGGRGYYAQLHSPKSVLLQPGYDVFLLD